MLAVSNADLPMKLRRNIKPSKVKNHNKKLFKSIAERPSNINNREEFGHWEIDTVIGQTSKDDYVLLTILERKTRNAIFIKLHLRLLKQLRKHLIVSVMYMVINLVNYSRP